MAPEASFDFEHRRFVLIYMKKGGMGGGGDSGRDIISNDII